LGQGYSTVSVADGLIYTTGMVEGNEGVLFAHDLDGQLKWSSPYGLEWHTSHPGARCTPSVASGRVYVVSGQGSLVCFDAKTGNALWTIDATKTFGGKPPKFGYAESVLIDGKNVIFTAGGPDATIVALDRMTGKTVWTTKGFSDISAYCSPIVIKRGNKRLIVTMTETSIVGVDADTGNLAWQLHHQALEGIHPNTPAYHDGAIYATSGYNTGGELVKVSADGATASQAWIEKALDCHHGGVLLIDGYIYGTSHKGDWLCVEWATGTMVHREKGIGKASVAYAEGMIYGYGENGTVGLIKPSPEGLQVVSSFKVTKGTNKHWAHPVIANGRLYIRHGEAMMAYDITAK
jgi:hypothetical protein